MDAVAEIRRNPVSKRQPIRFSLSVENERAGAGRDGRTVSRDEILWRYYVITNEDMEKEEEKILSS